MRERPNRQPRKPAAAAEDIRIERTGDRLLAKRATIPVQGEAKCGCPLSFRFARRSEMWVSAIFYPSSRRSEMWVSAIFVGVRYLCYLWRALVQRYNNRTDKRARYRPKNPDKKDLGEPTVRKLNAPERKKLAQHTASAAA